MQTIHLARSIWKKFQLLINPYQSATVERRGRPSVHLRRAFLEICNLVWSGCQWRALPPKYGTRTTAHCYFTEWTKSGLFLRLCKLCLSFMDKRGKMRRDLHSIDGSQVVTQSLLKTIALISPQYRPKRAIKFSLLVDSDGTLLATTLSSAHQHDTNLLDSTLAQNSIGTGTYSKTKLFRDKGYIGGRHELTAGIHGYQPIYHPRKYHLDQLKPSQRKLLIQHRGKVQHRSTF
jgi:transposase